MLLEEPVLALDVDGVVVDYVSAIGAFAMTRGHVLGCEPHEERDWGLPLFLGSLTVPERRALYAEFAVDEAFSRIRILDGVVEAIVSMRAEFPGLRVVAVTSAGLAESARAFRETNLRSLGLDGLVMLDIGACKRDALAALPDGSVFVDDLEVNLEAGQAAGLTTVLFRQPYNSHVDHPRVMTDWRTDVDVLRRALRDGRLVRERDRPSDEVRSAVPACV